MFYLLLPLVLIGTDGLVVMFALLFVGDVLLTQAIGYIGDILHCQHGFGRMQVMYGLQQFIEINDLPLFVVYRNISRMGKNDDIVHGDLLPNVSVITNRRNVCLILAERIPSFVAITVDILLPLLGFLVAGYPATVVLRFDDIYTVSGKHRMVYLCSAVAGREHKVVEYNILIGRQPLQHTRHFVLS